MNDACGTPFRNWTRLEVTDHFTPVAATQGSPCADVDIFTDKSNAAIAQQSMDSPRVSTV